MRTFSGWYRDALGEESCAFELQGSELSTTIRGVRFSTTMPEDWEPPPDTPAELLASFDFGSDVLKNCALGFDVPVTAFDRADGDSAIRVLAL